MVRKQSYHEFRKWWYEGPGFAQSLLGEGIAGDLIKKAAADYEWDAPTSPYATYQDPVYAPTVEMWLERHTEVFRLLPKTTFVAEGDSMQYIESELNGLVNVTKTSTPFASLAVESAPTVVDIDSIKPGYYADPWKTNFISGVEATWQNAPKKDPAFIKKFHAEALPNQIDKLLTLDVDNAFGAGALMSLDVICSADAEASTTYCDAATDPDLYFGKASAEVTRGDDTDDTFGCGAGSGLSLPSSAAARVLKLDYIDDVVAASKGYSKNKRYIGITGSKTLNEMQKLIDPKQRFLNTEMTYQETLNGVSTRRGVKGGFTVGGYITNGITIPMFPCDHVANEQSGNRSATITDADMGNIYILDLDEIELRVAVPVSFLETQPAAMLTGDYLQKKSMYLWGAQLLATNFRSHAAVKYLKTS